MVRSVRLLVSEMDKEGHAPIRSTSALPKPASREDGRIKSAVGIGQHSLADGTGDTIRVKPREPPKPKIPWHATCRLHDTAAAGHLMIPATQADDFDYLRPTRRPTRAVANIGGSNVPVVITSLPAAGKATTRHNSSRHHPRLHILRHTPVRKPP